MIPRHHLSPCDFEWFLDHPRRRYRIITDDACGHDEDCQPRAVLIIPRDGGPHVVAAFDITFFADADWHAENLLIANLESDACLWERVQKAKPQQCPGRSPDRRPNPLNGEEA